MQSILRARTWDIQPFLIQLRAVRLRYTAKGDPHEGHPFHLVKAVGHEMVSLVPLALRKGIILETRSVSFLIRAG